MKNTIHDPKPITTSDKLAVLFAMVFPSVITYVYFIHAADWPTSSQQMIFGTCKFIQFAFPAAWIFLVPREKLRLQRPTWKGIPLGIAFGLAILVGMLGLYYGWLKTSPVFDDAAKAARAKVAGLGFTGPIAFFALGAFYSIVHSFMEEYYWRWYVFGQGRKMVGVNAAIVISALAFMGHHVVVLSLYFGLFSLPTIVFSLAVAVGGGVWAWLYHRSGSLYGPWISHIFADIGIFWIGWDLISG